MIEPMVLARMMQKFAAKKPSVAQSTAPVLRDGAAEFPVHDDKGNVLMVSVRRVEAA